MTTVDYLIVGAGLTGGTIARLLADDHREVLLLERRANVGGNVHDFIHDSGVRVHTYGPHYFRCRNLQIWEFVNRFGKFYSFRPTVKSLVRGQYEPWPLRRTAFERLHGWHPDDTGMPPQNFEEACLQKMPRRFYQIYVEGYTRRQWGIEPRLLEAKLANRVRINADGEPDLTPHYAYQGLPEAGYAGLMSNLAGGIACQLNVNFLEVRHEYRARKALIFTGAIDEFFGFDLGRLTYRAQQRKQVYLPDLNWYQPCGQVNHPDATEADPVRTVEWKHLMPPAQQSQARGTIITEEYPFTPKDPEHFEYPMPLARDEALYHQYRARVRGVPGLIVCGRLGEFRYLDMDQAIARALLIGRKLLAGDAFGA